MRCPRCGREADEVHDSAAAGGPCCLTCHLAAAPPSVDARRWRPPRPAPPPDLPTYTQMVYRVWDWLEERAARPPLPIDAHRLVADCPVAGCDGTLSVRFYDTATGPELAVESADGGADRCSAGCTLDQILGAVAA